MSWEIVGVAFSLMGLLISGAWALVKIVVRQFEARLDERFALQERAREEGSAQWSSQFARFEMQQRDLERDFLTFRADLPLNYVRREDQIRRDTILDAKLDAMNARLDLYLERQQQQKGAIGG